MAKIFVIDDDPASELLVDNLRFRGHTAERLRSTQEALSKIEAIKISDLVVLDLIMPTDHDQRNETDHHQSSGMHIYTKLREATTTLPIIVYTANQDGGIIDVISSDRAASYVPRWSSPSLSKFIELVNEMLGLPNSKPPIATFIVHGQDEASKYAVKNYLQNTLHLPEPVILHEQPNLGRTIIEKFEDLSRDADLVFVLLTPDDVVAGAGANDTEKRRARQNVIFELGFFLGHLGRRSGRVFLLYKGGLELPSDISGLIYLNFDAGIESVGEQIRKEIQALGRMGSI